MSTKNDSYKSSKYSSKDQAKWTEKVKKEGESLNLNPKEMKEKSKSGDINHTNIEESNDKK